jgi:hypothetical protein
MQSQFVGSIDVDDIARSQGFDAAAHIATENEHSLGSCPWRLRYMGLRLGRLSLDDMRSFRQNKFS